MSNSHIIPPDKVWETLFGHNSVHITMVSNKTGERKTYHVVRFPKKGDEPRPLKWWVKQVTGGDAKRQYAYLCWAEGGDDGYVRLKLSKASPSSGWKHAGLAAFLWLFKGADGQHNSLSQATVYKGVDCTRCGRLLTVPSSITFTKHGVEMPRGPFCQTQP
jgi:hypothetical protein